MKPIINGQWLTRQQTASMSVGDALQRHALIELIAAELRVRELGSDQSPSVNWVERFQMKRLRSNSNLGRRRYSGSRYVERAGVGTRELSMAEIERLQAHVERIRGGAVAHPIRLKVPG